MQCTVNIDGVSCGKSFHFQRDFNDHFRRHCDNKPFRCGFCNQPFASKSELRNHSRIHAENRKMFQCEFCDKKLTRKQGLDAHRRTHTGERPYICNICQKSFKQKNGLDYHQNNHHNTENHWMNKKLRKRTNQCSFILFLILFPFIYFIFYEVNNEN